MKQIDEEWEGFSDSYSQMLKYTNRDQRNNNFLRGSRLINPENDFGIYYKSQ